MQELPEFAGPAKMGPGSPAGVACLVSHWEGMGTGNAACFSYCGAHRMKCLLHRMLNETHFDADYGRVRALSKNTRERALPGLVLAEGRYEVT